MKRPYDAAWIALFCTAALIPMAVEAHSFSTPYVFPIPFWIYTFGCIATLILTFALLCSFSRDRAERQHPTAPATPIGRLGPKSLSAMRVAAIGSVALTLVAGFIGGPDPGQNIAIALFWVVFLQGLAYSTLLFGDIYSVVNPWKFIIERLEALGLDFSKPRISIPVASAGWLSFATYVALIWIELFTSPAPFNVAMILTVYSALTITGVAILGKSVWFAHCDFPERFFSSIGRLAPIAYEPNTNQSGWLVKIRYPLAGGLADHPKYVAGIVFILFMMSSTTYDTIHQTDWWIKLFWNNALSVAPHLRWIHLGNQDTLVQWFDIYRKIGLLAFSAVYLLIYIVFIKATRILTKTDNTTRELSLRFSLSLIPIAMAYNFAHYLTMFSIEIANFACVAVDPFDLEWTTMNIDNCPTTMPFGMDFIWHLEVFVLLAGHVGGVYLSHVEAIRLFSSPRQMVLGQLPLFMLMIVYTVFGLWTLSLPLGPVG